MIAPRRSLPAAASPNRSVKPQLTHRILRLVERIMAGIALLNLLLVAFDLSYIPWRNWYLRQVPVLTHWYGATVKGIEPHRDTEAYLDAVNRLTVQVERTGLRSAAVSIVLAELRDLSVKMVDENPFESAGKSGTLERIKNKLRDRIGNDSSKQAFSTFWSQNYLTQADWSQEINFFNRQIRPLMATNYFRHLSESGGFVDRFWRIDLGFIALFGVDFLVRTFALSRRYRGVTWLDTMLWRWYDVLLILPFWRWLRLLPVTIRLNQAKLLNLTPLQTRLNQVVVTSLAIELTEVVVLRILDQLQELIRQGTISRWLISANAKNRYIDLSGVDEVEAIAYRVLSVLVHNVLPKIKPEVDALIQHSLIRVLQQSPIYGGFQTIPGFTNLPNELTIRVATEMSEVVYQALTTTLDDQTTLQLTRRLLENLAGTFWTEVKQERTLEELEAMIVALLSEIRVSYVNQIATEDIEKLREQTHQLYEMTRNRN